MKEFKVFDKQSWFDVAIYLFGDASKAMDLALLNQASITDDLISGKIIFYEDLEKNKLVINSMSSNQSIPATALSKLRKLEIDIVDYGGIGEMIIESTFIVS